MKNRQYFNGLILCCFSLGAIPAGATVVTANHYFVRSIFPGSLRNICRLHTYPGSSNSNNCFGSLYFFLDPSASGRFAIATMLTLQGEQTQQSLTGNAVSIQQTAIAPLPP